ncbi:MAG: sugar transferase [Candidatus Paceibacterota bacterium]|jgi:lipopolysaccharide/colanic/teichoic acid biosynthesis glycosyltransferase
MIKRLFDIILSGLGLLVLSLPFLVFALIIKITAPGPVFYRGERTGLHGKMFKIFKFRSMIVDAEKTGVASTSKEDNRVTKIGKFMRKTKIDELPQLINVFKGDMSFVGPRPEVKKFTDLYTEEEKVLLNIRPGITDYASLWDINEAEVLAGSSDPDKDYLEKIRPEKVRLQLKYYKEMSLWTDMKIIFLTIKNVIM